MVATLSNGWRRFFILTVALTLSGCCCCDPSALEQFSGPLLQEQREKAEQAIREIEKSQRELQEAQVEAQEAMEQMEQLEQLEQLKPAEAEPAADEAPAAKNPTERTGVAKPAPPTKAPVQDLAGSYRDSSVKATDMRGGVLKFEISSTGVLKGTFLGSYRHKAFHVDINGKVDKRTGEVTASGTDDKKREMRLNGTHEGDKIAGKITGMVAEKAIVATFDAKKK